MLEAEFREGQLIAYIPVFLYRCEGAHFVRQNWLCLATTGPGPLLQATLVIHLITPQFSRI